MGPLPLILCLVLPVAAIETKSTPPMLVLQQYNAALANLFSKTTQAYLGDKPVMVEVPDPSMKETGALLTAMEKETPEPYWLAGSKSADAEFRLLREQAAGIQLGRDPQVTEEIFLASIGVLSAKLRLSKDNAAKAALLYGKRMRAAGSAPKSQAQTLLEAQGVQLLLEKKNLTPAQSAALALKAGQYANALGGLIFIDAEGNSSIVGQTSKGPLTQEELARMAKLPRFQMPASFTGFGAAPPFPVTKVADKALKPGDPGFVYGFASSAYKYWDDMEKRQGDLVGDGKRGVLAATFVATGATIMKGFYHMSGFGAVEQSSRQLDWDLDRGAHTGTVAWSATKLGTNSLLAALNFVPGVSAVKGLWAGETVLRTAKAGTTIVELGGGVGRASAGTVANELRTVVTTTAGEGGQVVTSQARTLLSNLGQATKKYGVTVVEDRSFLGMGSATGDASTIVINTRMGAAHEVTHAFQQAQIRMTLLQEMGKPYEALSVAEKALFAKKVTAMETVAYNTFEKGAYGATGFMGSGSLSTGRYAAGLEANIAGFEGGLASGVVPNIKLAWNIRPGAAVYTELPNWLGQSQMAIATNLGATMSMSRDTIFPAIDRGIGSVMQSGFELVMGGSSDNAPNPKSKTKPKGS